jgi:phosphohistidine phosphatase
VTQPAPKRLTLVRHAKSDWSDRSLDDFDRPLNARGTRDAPEMAMRARAAGLVPTLMISSPARRALETARAFADALGYPRPRIRQADEAYLASPGELLEVVRSRGGSARHLMLFGHNPGISGFGAWLAGDDSLGEVPTCAITSLLVPVRRWSELEFGSARRDFYDFPKSGH